MLYYQTTCKDKFGQEDTFIESDGSSLKVTLRGIDFNGQCLNDFQPVDIKSGSAIESFHFDQYNYLTDCELTIIFPIRLKTPSGFVDAPLTVCVKLENSDYPKTKTFSLTIDKDAYNLNKDGETGMWFESQMIALQRLLPAEIKIKSCLFCAFSNYGVGGSDAFGTLICYKQIKDEIIHFKSKDEYMDVAAGHGIAIQETFYCPEFEDIKPGQMQYKDEI